MSESTEFVIRWSQGYITQKDFKKLTKKLSEKELMELMAKVSEIFIQVPSRKWRGSWMWKLVVNHFKVVACQICFSQINWTKVRKILNNPKVFFFSLMLIRTVSWVLRSSKFCLITRRRGERTRKQAESETLFLTLISFFRWTCLEENWQYQEPVSSKGHKTRPNIGGLEGASLKADIE